MQQNHNPQEFNSPAYPRTGPVPPLPRAQPYPPPRRPLTQHGHVHQQPPRQPHRKRKRGRLGLILGISIPVAIVTVVGLIAAHIVAPLIIDRQAAEAAATYNAERDAWVAVYNKDTLRPFTALGMGDALPSMDQLGILPASADEMHADLIRTGCDNVATLTQQFATIGSVAPPSMPNVSGGESNDAYAAAVRQWAEEEDAYNASVVFTRSAKDWLERIGDACAFSLRYAEIVTTHLRVYNEVYLPLLTLSHGDTETHYYAELGVSVTFSCGSQIGCVSAVDMDARREAGNAWDAAFGPLMRDMVTLHTDLCPSNDVADSCEFWSLYWQRGQEATAAIGDVFRTENPVENGAHNLDETVDTTPALRAANVPYMEWATSDREQTFDDCLEATGYYTVSQAVAASSREWVRAIETNALSALL